MEAAEQIRLFQEFIELNHHAELLEQVRKGESALQISFNALIKFNPELAEHLLDQPEEVIKAAELSITNFDIQGSIKNFRIRIKEMGTQHKMLIRNIRSKHLNKLLLIEGTVRQKSDVRPQVTSARFECPSCGNIMNVLQLDSKFKEPQKCGCGRKGRFRLVSKELVDVQGIVLEEATKDLDGGEQPKRINIILKNDLVSPISEKKTNPGSSIRIIGALKENPIILRTGGQSTKYEIFIDANNVEALQEDYTNIEISEEEEKKIKELAQDPKIIEKLAQSIAPGIYGHEKIKEALILQFVSGVKKTRDDGVSTRGDMHILLIGDPGAGKCVAGDTQIVLETGEICTIKEMYDKQEQEKNTMHNAMHPRAAAINLKGEQHHAAIVRYWRRKAPNTLLKITTSTGNELYVTKNHPLFTTDNGIIFAREAQEYKKGEYLALPRRIRTNGELQLIPEGVEKTQANNRVKYTLIPYLNESWARLLGYLVGDGYVRERKTTGVLSFTNKNQEILNDFERLITEVLSLGVSKRKKQNTDCYEYYCCSRDIVQILKAIEPAIIKRSDQMNISGMIQKSPDTILKEFVKSLFECEAHVNKNKREIEFSTKSKTLANQVKSVLLRFGIVSQISSAMKYAANTKEKKQGRYYRLRITGKQTVQFKEHIGFISKEKQCALQKIVESDKPFNTNIDVIPNVKDLLKVLRAQSNRIQNSFEIPRTTYEHYENGDRHPSRENMQSIARTYEQQVQGKSKEKHPLIEIIAQIAHADIFWDKIKEIDEIPSTEEYVYDLEIEQVHNFVANGVIVHNSQLLKRAAVVAPKSRYVSGKGVSGAGLSAAVVKDEFLSGWSLEAGAMVLANKGILMIDELDKMSDDDRSAMHEALEQQSISISKANIQATLHCETTVLAAANPKFGRFDPYETIGKQIDLPPALINRFDLIFTIKDIPDKDKDEKMADFILSLHKERETEKPEIETLLLRKYLAYAKQRIIPQLTSEALEELKAYYLKMRLSGSEEKGMRAIPISARQLEALIRLAEAAARARLSKMITRDDARRAVALVHYCLEQVGLDPETGKIDIDRISTGITTSERTKIIGIREVINELEHAIGKVIPLDEIIKAAKDKGMDEEKVIEAIEKLKRSGDIFEPKRGSISKI